MNFEKALDDIRQGKVVLVYDFDNREGEADLTVASQFATFETVRFMRKNAGGLICTTTPYERAKNLGLPYMTDVYRSDPGNYPLLKKMIPNDLPYDNTKSSFGITVNHRKTFTGVTDGDRAMTIARYAEVIFQNKPDEEIIKDLGNEFRSPGHVHLLNASENLLTSRKGHTELCTALMYMAGVLPSATICEMMGDDGKAMSKEKTMKFAEDNDIEYITGDQVIEKWDEFRGKAEAVR
ncbi:MAG: 3,4-dihydroxy-2-butanone-4-phosphate synthase [Candidatus Methanomethylophilaceae archaeon]|jgi:3,4-dihydroxy 2-butanone 4-phosphate synthase